MWIWSISIPSERERRVASFIISFLDCISHTYEVPLLSGNLSWHVKFHTEITHQFTFSPKVDMSPFMRHKEKLANRWNSITFGDTCWLDQCGILMSEITQL